MATIQAGTRFGAASQRGWQYRLHLDAPLLITLIAAAVLAAVVLVRFMYDMSTAMREMTGYVGSLSRDVSSMNTSMAQMSLEVASMNQSIQRIEGSMRGMGQAISQGSEQFQQWNPADMMKQVVPGTGKPMR